MKKSLKIVALLLALITILSVLSACSPVNNNNNNIDKNKNDNSDTQTEESQNKLVILSDGVSQFAIVRPGDLKSKSATVQAAKSIWNELNNYTLSEQIVTLKDDKIDDGSSHDTSAYEILVGNTNYDETATVKSETAENAWTIKVIGHKIVIFAHTDECITKAATVFVNLLKANLSLGKNEQYSIAFAEESINLSRTVTRASLDVPQPEGYSSVSFYTTSLEGDEAIYADATRKMYDAYIKKLKDSGFKVFSETEMNGCPFATLYDCVNTIHTGFYENESTIRSIVENFDSNGLFGAEADNKYTTITTTNIAEIGVAYYDSSAGKNKNTGECVVIRLADGRFIVFDGGHRKSDEMSNLIKYLNLQAKDYKAKTDNKITIAAWIITHPHSDHWGCLTGYYDQLGKNNIYVENIIYNFLSDEERQKTAKQSDATYNNSGDNSTLPTIAKKLGANVITCHVGNTYYIANMKLEVLFTMESYCKVPNDLNALSPVMKMSFYDPETSKLMNTFMHVGDATGYTLRCTANTFKEFLLTDIGQVPHHGASTKGDDGGNILFFKYNKPATLLWTAGSGCAGYSSNSYLACAVNKSKNKNFKEYFFSDKWGRAVILTLPYTPGNAQEINNYLK